MVAGEAEGEPQTHRPDGVFGSFSAPAPGKGVQASDNTAQANHAKPR